MISDELILLLGDVHANDSALSATLADAYRRYPGYSLPVWFLGDLFGRGPQPAEAWHTLQSAELQAMIVGNHDWGITGRYANLTLGNASEGDFQRSDWEVILAHRKQLALLSMLKLNGANQPVGGELYHQLSSLPVVAVPRQRIFMIHGGLERAVPTDLALDDIWYRFVWDYLKSARHADFTIAGVRWLLERWPERSPYISVNGSGPGQPELIIVGHYHVRFLYDGESRSWVQPVTLDHFYPLTPDRREPVVLSPGSVGFPREERDRDASYAVLALSGGRMAGVAFHTCPYDRHAVRQMMRAQSYPNAVIRRLHLPGEPE